MRHLKDLPVLILGLGASGLAMARWCARHGAQVTVADTREAPALLDTLRAEWPEAVFVGGPFTAALIEGTPIRAVYRSPGLSPETIAPVADAARAVGLPVGGELDLFARALADLAIVETPAVVEVEEESAAQGELALEAAVPAESEPVPEAQAPAVLPEVQAPAAEEAPAAAEEAVVETPAMAEAVEAVAPAIEAQPAEPEALEQTSEAPRAPAALPESMPRDPSLSVPVLQPPEPEAPVADAPVVQEGVEAGAEPVAAETPDAAEGTQPEVAEPAEPAPVAAPAPKPASNLPAFTVGKPYVPTAAKEAADFVAKIAEFAATNPASAVAEEEPAPQAEAQPEPEPAPEPAKGYTPVVLAITGTNGKTTVTALTGQLIERGGKSVAVAGNIGPTLLDTLSAHLDAGTLPEAWVIELSSFQLDGVQGFEPAAATVLNLTQDHLDWHGDMPAYAQAKSRIFGKTALMVLNRDDPAVMAMLATAGQEPVKPVEEVVNARGARRAPARPKAQRVQVRPHVTFGASMPQRPGDYGIERVNGMSWLVRAHEADETQKRKRGQVVEEEIFVQRLMPADALRIRGRHNAMNALAALALANAADCPLGPMLYGLREYRGEPHRVEPVALIDDVEYFDDSKGTNVGATVAALGGLGEDRRVVVILGGEGKGQDFEPLALPVRQYARAVVLIGRDAPLIEAALAATGVTLMHAGSMHEAVQLAARRAHPGDAVLLSPACASFDMFKNYPHRAAVFREAVQALEDEPRDFGEPDSTEGPAS
ncbi:UDP-N-acetylmuramoylalanine--D-glutamate ligase [Variovorax paradoxus]|jgi:UDP-N-acetylmuramoylalanine--D-glutamate ligase|uniref:Mur ligase family protein n=1 Tax=Variovorax paradoxus TaxID=34073 RepID=UPI0006E54C64|nr:UDP-N-acetylmuramoylalanine--D-glutamate ligase [Variovorax paradoxus]KPV05606.1 UDP-N-acetylmuramoylalanine--D-glutamate ligase [Variovorax paradoxus]